MIPIYKITADDKDITAAIRARFISLSIKDSAGVESDSLTLVLSDADKALVFPAKGVTLKAYIGYSDSGLIYKGSFIVDELDYSWAPNELSILARASDEQTIGSGKQTKQRTDLSLGELVESIADDHDLIPAVSESLASIAVNEYQVDESDMNYLTRLAERFSAITKVKNGRLLFLREGVAQSASGFELPVFELAKHETSKGVYSERRPEEFDGVVATYYERYYKAGIEEYFRRKAYYQIGNGQYIHRVPGIMKSYREAVTAAALLNEKLSSSASTLSITIDQGIPSLIAESSIVLSGFIDKISLVDWRAETVTHSLTSSAGLKTTLSLERLILTS